MRKDPTDKDGNTQLDDKIGCIKQTTKNSCTGQKENQQQTITKNG